MALGWDRLPFPSPPLHPTAQRCLAAPPSAFPTSGLWDPRCLFPHRLLQDLFPKASELYERVASNREQWTKVSHKFTIRGLPSNNSLDFLDEDYDPQTPDPQMNGCLDAEGHPESGAE